MSDNNGHFATTRWSVIVQAASQSDDSGNQALQQLCEAYWRPLYLFVRGKGHSAEDAADLAQGFFTHVLEKRVFLGCFGPVKWYVLRNVKR